MVDDEHLDWASIAARESGKEVDDSSFIGEIDLHDAEGGYVSSSMFFANFFVSRERDQRREPVSTTNSS
jgi:hypothetical protein